MNTSKRAAYAAIFSTLLFTLPTAMASTLTGYVTDNNGNALPNIQVIYARSADAQGASVVTVFSDEEGRFSFAQTFPESISSDSDIQSRGLGYRQLKRSVDTEIDTTSITFILQKERNQVSVAPASAWLQRIEDPQQKADFIMNCIDCHQVPSSEIRNYAASIDDINASDPVAARHQSWDGIVKYMNFLSAWEFSRAGRDEGDEIDTEAVYSVENEAEVVDALTEFFDDRMDYIEGYEWGAPLIATAQTAIWEYAIPEPNTTREAVMLGNPRRLLAADVGANRLISIDVKTGQQHDLELPTDYLTGPHSLHRSNDGQLWVTSLFNSTVAKLNPDTEEWQVWHLTFADGSGAGIHDLSFSDKHELLADDKGRIWFSDIGNRGVGYFDPLNGNMDVWTTPVAENRSDDSALYGSASVYGLIMTSDHKEVWYSQLGNGVFGGFNIETEEFIGPFELPSANAGPRRITITDNDVMYMALYGTGQIAEFDIKTRKMLGIYDLPDTGSSPYAVTWDPIRQVVWVATANTDVIYRFDPETKEYGVLPLPREQTFLRMIDIDPQTGVLITSYANIVEIVNGPRMALIIDPGDGAYPHKFSPDTPPTPAH